MKFRLTKAARDAADALRRLGDVDPAGTGSTLTPTVEERQRELVEFYQHYEALVELLCDAAQFGADPAREIAYQTERHWMEDHYPNLRRFVVAYLQYDATDAVPSLAWHGRAADAFEALFAAPTLAEFVRCDDGYMISRIVRTRDALHMYGEHLRHLQNAQP